MSKIEIGDRVKVINKSSCFYGLVGRVTEAPSGIYDYQLQFNNGLRFSFDEGDLELVPASWDTLLVGDIIVGDIIVDTDTTEAKIKILEVGVNCFLYSGWNNFETTNYWITLERARKKGWKIKEQDTEVVEMTVAEVSKKLGYTVKIVK